jgi:hypothetical protein
MVDGGAHQRYRLVAICTASLLTRHVHVKHRYIAQEVPPAQEHFADLRQQRLSAITLGIRVAVHQRKAQGQPGETQLEVIAGSFGNR